MIAADRVKPVRTPPPRPTAARPFDFGFLVAINAALIIGMWVRHGGVALLGSTQANLVAVGQLTALLGTFAALIQLVLMSRSPWLDRTFGADHLAHWHRWLGFSCVTLICAHVVFSTLGYAVADKVSFFAEAQTLITTYPFMLMATVATGLFVVIALTSLRAARRRLKYETWHFIHLYTYLAIALAFGHEMAVGFDLTADPVADIYWVALYAVVIASVLIFRVGHPLQLAARHRLQIADVVYETPDVASLYITGRDLASLRATPGQFFRWRFLTRSGWWKSHPFSLSAAPNDQFLRITVKAVGDGSYDAHRLSPGTKVIAEGPYGVFTEGRRSQGRTLLIAGGIGITPLRALLEDLPAGKGNIVLIYRASRWEDVIFKEELEQWLDSRRGVLHFVIGERGTPEMPHEPFTATWLRQTVPDIVHRDIFICGPPALMTGLHETLKQVGVPPRQVHYERFALL